MNKANKDSYIEAYILMSDRFRILIYTTVIVLRLLIVYWLCTSVAFSVIFFQTCLLCVLIKPMVSFSRFLFFQVDFFSFLISMYDREQVIFTSLCLVYFT